MVKIKKPKKCAFCSHCVEGVIRRAGYEIDEMTCSRHHPLLAYSYWSKGELELSTKGKTRLKMINDEK
jgi:hypothetical protein